MCVVKEGQRQEKGKLGVVGEGQGGGDKIRWKSNSITRRLPDYDSLLPSQSLGRNSHISVSIYPLNAAQWLKNIRMWNGQFKTGQSYFVTVWTHRKEKESLWSAVFLRDSHPQLSSSASTRTQIDLQKMEARQDERPCVNLEPGGRRRALGEQDEPWKRCECVWPICKCVAVMKKSMAGHWCECSATLSTVRLIIVLEHKEGKKKFQKV